MSTLELTGRAALVTGGARGIGAAVAEALANAGASVTIGDVLEAEGKATAEAIGKTGATARFVKLDVTDEADWEAAVATTISELGGLDILVNNAGILTASLVVDTDPAEVRRMNDINIVGTLLGMKHGLRAMRPGGPAGHGGSIVNLSSGAALIAFPSIAGYSATKSAVDRMTRIAAQESGKLGYGVRVNCVYPGFIGTSMAFGLAEDMARLGLAESAEAALDQVIGSTPLGRLGDVTDVADVVVFLASDASRFTTGAGVPVDGGMGL
jgi:NAD(P)-dependent dehydrogenase (short-subunit alcohol dehydrogenase family)